MANFPGGFGPNGPPAMTWIPQVYTDSKMNKNQESNKYVLFWHGPFSQWHPSEFKVDGITYNCAEQYMMAEKARLFGDSKSRGKIMKSNSPREQKALGRQVSNFDKGKWESVAREIVFKGNMAKFSQNKDLKEKLLATGDKTLVEASPYDKVWGIGLSANDPNATKPGNWKGTNWLGEVLMRVRKELSEKGDV
jgi:ribA/ribD-fused uncharacterized protein